MSDKNNSWFPALPIVFLFMSGVIISTHYTDSVYSGAAPSVFSYPDSYRTGVPSKSEITYGTKKTFQESKMGAWAHESWEWPQSIKDQNIYSHTSSCGGVDWYWDSEEEPGKPYVAHTYHNFSDHHNFATLKEADAFVEQWCK